MDADGGIGAAEMMFPLFSKKLGASGGGGLFGGLSPTDPRRFGVGMNPYMGYGMPFEQINTSGPANIPLFAPPSGMPAMASQVPTQSLAQQPMQAPAGPQNNQQDDNFLKNVSSPMGRVFRGMWQQAGFNPFELWQR